MQIEWLILADAAQVVGNKLFLLGGGWDRLTLNRGFPAPHALAVALSFRVPWNETNQKHSFRVAILNADGKQLAEFGGQLEVGRPPGIPAGQDQRIQAAVNVNMRLEAPGTYEVVASVGEQESARAIFNVVGR